MTISGKRLLGTVGMDSDPEIEIIEKDSGMSSIGDSKDDTPERKEPVSNEG